MPIASPNAFNALAFVSVLQVTVTICGAPKIVPPSFNTCGISGTNAGVTPTTAASFDVPPSELAIALSPVVPESELA